MIVNYSILQAYTRETPNRRTAITIRFSWLAKMGFVSGALVCAVPQQDGFTLTLQNNENTGHGKTLCVGLEQRPRLSVSIARDFPIPELSGGDFLAAAYEYGTITARKLPPADKYYVVDTQNHGAYLRLNGGWMDEAGFPPDTIAIVASDNNLITFSAWNGKHSEYPELVKHARKHKWQVIQTREAQAITFMELFADSLDKVGLKHGDIAGIRCEHGKMTLFKPTLTTTEA
jgi:hypothetical protein